MPTAWSLLVARLPERGVFYGILAAIGVGLPVFAYGNFTGRTDWTVAGSLLTVTTPALAIAVHRRRRGLGSRVAWEEKL